MTRSRIGVGNVVVAGLIGCAAAIYAINGMNPAGWVRRPGLWDLMALVTCEPRFTGPILLTTALLRTVLLAEPILPALIRRGTYRRVLLTESVSCVRALLLPITAILLGATGVAICAGLDPGTRLQPGSAAAAIAEAHMPLAVGILAQIALVAAALTVVNALLVATRMAFGSVIPAVVGAFACWSWMGVSVIQLQTVFDPSLGTTALSAIAASLRSSAAAALNSSTYLDLVIALGTGAVPVVIATLVIVALAAYTVVAVMDLRVRRARRRPLTARHGSSPIGL